MRSHVVSFLVAWVLPILALTVNPPIPRVIPAPAAATSQGQPASTTLPPEEDHHPPTTTVALQSDAQRARKKAPRTIPLPPRVLVPPLRLVHASADLQQRALLVGGFSLKLHRAQLPRRTGPADGHSGLS